MTAPASAAAEVAGRLTDAQRKALIAVIDFLDVAAGEGLGFTTPYGVVDADEALYDLANAFTPDWLGDQTYSEWIRALLLKDQQQ